MRYADADVRFALEVHRALSGVGHPEFWFEVPAGAYGAPHAAPEFNPRTGEAHPRNCPCEKCQPGSGCQCYACRMEVVLRADAT